MPATKKHKATPLPRLSPDYPPRSPIYAVPTPSCAHFRVRLRVEGGKNQAVAAGRRDSRTAATAATKEKKPADGNFPHTRTSVGKFPGGGDRKQYQGGGGVKDNHHHDGRNSQKRPLALYPVSYLQIPVLML